MRRPSDAVISSFLISQRSQGFSYSQVGASRGNPPAGYTIDHNRVRVGQGADDFARAAESLRRWQMFELGWLDLCWPNAPIQAGSTVAVLVRALGVWWLNACRIVYVLDEGAPTRRFGFAYGTLSEHAEQGEERFSVEWRPSDDSVWYEIFAFSRPKHWLARVGYPLSRQLQFRFAIDSMHAMLSAVDRSRRIDFSDRNRGSGH